MTDFQLFRKYNYYNNRIYNRVPIDYYLQETEIPQWTILLHGSYNCNLQCIYCENHVQREKYNNAIMSEDVARQVVQKLGPYVKEITWHGGESLLLPESLLKIPSEEKEKNNFTFEISLQTNGLLLNKKIDFLKKYNIGIGGSFDGLYNTDSRGEKSTISSLDLLKNYNLNDFFSFITVYTRKNIDILIENYEYYKKLGVKRFQSCVVRENVGEGDNPYLVDNNNINKILNYIDYWIHDTNHPIIDTYLMRHIKRVLGVTGTCEDVNCIGRWLIVDPLGNITTCAKIGIEDSFCNIQDISSYKDLFNNAKFKETFYNQTKLIKEKCYDCDWAEVCFGCCMGLNYEKDNNYKQLNMRQCEFTKKLLNGIYELIKDIDIKNTNKYNEIFLDILKECNYISLSKIKEREQRFNFFFNNDESENLLNDERSV